MADTSPVILVAGTASVPASYVVPPTQELSPLVCNATFDGTNAAGAFLPTLEIVSDGGVVIARCPVAVQDAVAAGDSAEVTFAPFLRQSRTGAGYVLVENQGTALPPESTLDFTGAGVTAADDPTNGRTTVTIPGGAAGSYTLLKTITLTTNTTIDWGVGVGNTIPQTYRDIICTITGRTSDSLDIAQLLCQLNNDTASNYEWNYQEINNGAQTFRHAPFPTAAPAEAGTMPGNFNEAANYGKAELVFLGYCDTLTYKTCVFRTSTLYAASGTSAEGFYSEGEFTYRETAAVTRITFPQTFLAGSRADFYGRGTQ